LPTPDASVAKRGIATVSCVSVRPSVCFSVTLAYYGKTSRFAIYLNNALDTTGQQC